jgi:hypothetical protein
LLTPALIQVLKIRESVGVAGVVAHALDGAAAAFYEHQGFTRFRDKPEHLYYPLATFTAGLAGSSWSSIAVRGPRVALSCATAVLRLNVEVTPREKRRAIDVPRRRP